MPLVLGVEEEQRQAASTGPLTQQGFDLQSASTLFWKQVPLLLRQPDREEQNEELNFRILTGISRANHNMRVLRIHITSETDLFFMHSLEVSEEDFQALKNEQGILVDFASFPMKIITLLDKCTCIQPVHAPRFQAVLTVRGSESVFRIVETNDFKQLPHISLSFRPGNDAAVKQYLAFRLLEVKSDVEDLKTQLAASQAAASSSSGDLSKARQQLATLQEQYDKHLLEVQAEYKTQQAIGHEARAREKAEVKEAHDKELADIHRRHTEVVQGLSSRLEAFDGENRKLREAKYELDTKVSELSAKLGSAEGSCRALEEEVSRLRSTTAQLGGDKAEKEVLAHDLRARLSAAEEKVKAQADLLEAQRSRVRDLESSLKSSEARTAELRDSCAASEARLKESQQELERANDVVDKLQADIRASKDKSKRKQAIIVRQEEELGAREEALAAAAKEQQQLSHALDQAKSELQTIKNENAELRAKLEDSKQQLQSNEQMIRWLNQQVTEAQLGSGATGYLSGSRYRPAALPAPAGATAAGSLTAGSAASMYGATPATKTALLPAPPAGHAAAVVSATPSVGGVGSATLSGMGTGYGRTTFTSKYTPSYTTAAATSYLDRSQPQGAAAMGSTGLNNGGTIPSAHTQSAAGGFQPSYMQTPAAGSASTHTTSNSNMYQQPTIPPPSAALYQPPGRSASPSVATKPPGAYGTGISNNSTAPDEARNHHGVLPTPAPFPASKFGMTQQQQSSYQPSAGMNQGQPQGSNLYASSDYTTPGHRPGVSQGYSAYASTMNSSYNAGPAGAMFGGGSGDNNSNNRPSLDMTGQGFNQQAQATPAPSRFFGR